jgi:hypothetical protein
MPAAPSTLVTTVAGGMRARRLAPARTFEPVIYVDDFATVLGVPPDVPAIAAAQTLVMSCSPTLLLNCYPRGSAVQLAGLRPSRCSLAYTPNAPPSW